MAVVRHGLVRSGIAGDHYGAIRGIEPIAVRLRPLSMVYGEGRHRHVLIPVDDARIDLMHIHFVSGLVGVL